jgi:hypothetical protein
MRHLLLFEGFIQNINELEFGNHWIERTSYPDEEKSGLSRILPYNSNFLFGYEILHFADENYEEFSVDHAVKDLDIKIEDIQYYITNCFRALTRSKKLKDWESSTNKDYLMIRLGSICFIKDDINLYPFFRARNGDYIYGDGECLWGMVKNKKIAKTIKFYPDTDLGRKIMQDASSNDAGKKNDLKAHQFKASSAIDYPYGKDFDISVNLNLGSKEEIVADIFKQVE